MSEPTKEEIRTALAVIRRDEIKGVVKDAIKEWLSEQLSSFGWWTLKGILALGLAGLLWLALVKAGWVPPQASVR